MKVIIHKEAEKFLKRTDNITKERLTNGIKGLNRQPPIGDTKPLKGEFYGLYRLRIGDYRIIYTNTDDGALKILNILPRGSAYK